MELNIVRKRHLKGSRYHKLFTELLAVFLQFSAVGPADTFSYCCCPKPKLFFKLRHVTGATHRAATNVSLSRATEVVMEPPGGVTPTAASSRLLPKEFAYSTSFISQGTLDRALLFAAVIVSSKTEQFSPRSTNEKEPCEFSGSHGRDMKMDVFWDVASCSFVEIDGCFKGAYVLQHQGTLIMVVVSNS
jgi:hypothetical protein